MQSSLGPDQLGTSGIVETPAQRALGTWYKQAQTAVLAGLLFAVGSLITPWASAHDPRWVPFLAAPYGAAAALGWAAQRRAQVGLAKAGFWLFNGTTMALLISWVLRGH